MNNPFEKNTIFKVPVYKPLITKEEKGYVLECLESTWISSKGKFISQFEKNFADFIKVSHATSVCNGTIALHLALLVLGIGEGDEVIVPTFTYIASANSIKYTGASPVFVDSLKETWQIDPTDAEKKLQIEQKLLWQFIFMVIHVK